jgi:hypothetical protein
MAQVKYEFAMAALRACGVSYEIKRERERERSNCTSIAHIGSERAPTVAEGLKTISAPFKPNIWQEVREREVMDVEIRGMSHDLPVERMMPAVAYVNGDVACKDQAQVQVQVQVQVQAQLRGYKYR